MMLDMQKQLIAKALEHSTERFLMIWDAAIDIGDVDTVEYYCTAYKQLMVQLGRGIEVDLAIEAIAEYTQQNTQD
jgi:hypothetical protein